MLRRIFLFIVLFCLSSTNVWAETGDTEQIVGLLREVLSRLDELKDENRQLREQVALLEMRFDSPSEAVVDALAEATEGPSAAPAAPSLQFASLIAGGNVPAGGNGPGAAPRHRLFVPASESLLSRSVLPGQVSVQSDANTESRQQPAAYPSVKQIADEVQARLPEGLGRYTMLNINVGPTANGGNVSLTGQARVFLPFTSHHALQTQGEFLHYLGRDEGQFDIGLVNRWGRFQASAFGSFKHVRFREFEKGGTLGQAALNLDYVFPRGRVGFVGAKGFLDGGVVNRAQVSRNVVEETYLALVDQAGVSAAIGAWGQSWFEGNFGAMFRRRDSSKPGGTIRYIHPLNDRVALTLEAGLNETLMSDKNAGRFVVGLQFGRWLSPDRYEDVKEKSPVPVDVPRIRYELLKRRIRKGNDAPVADAGPDRIGIEAGTIVLDGSASFDLDDDFKDLMFRWAQIGEETVEINNADQPRASFTAEAGRVYHFRLTVTDPQEAKGTDTVTISTVGSEINIKTFQVTPSTVTCGDTVVIEWEVENADKVEITKLGEVELRGTSSVPVDETTEFVLTASRGSKTVHKSITVTASCTVKIVRFTATPARIKPGEKAALSWTVWNADTVTLDPVGGDQQTTGSVEVAPTETTTYTLTAENEHSKVSAKVIVAVDEDDPGTLVRIIEFRANKTTVKRPGDPAKLTWKTENAVRVVITPKIGDVELNGSVEVHPVGQTTYNLLAYGEDSEVSAVVILDVEIPNLSPVAVAKARPPIVAVAEPTACEVTLDGSESYDPDGDPLTYEWRSIGARRAEIQAPRSAVTTAKFLDGFGDYQFELMVTDDKGAMESPDLGTVTVRCIDP
jgi:hypothetical protein